MAAPPIDSDAVMTGIKRKLARARALLDALLDDVDRVLTAGSEGPTRQNSDGTFSSFYIPREVPSPAWGIWVGEVAHHLRSAMDNTVTVLTLRNGTAPVRDNAFPVCLKPSEWRNRVEKKWPNAGPLANVSRTDADLIESLQPYRGVDLSTDPQGAARKPLAALTQVNNADKHAALHGAVACLAMTGSHRVLSIEPKVPVEILWTREPLTPLEAGMEMTRYQLLGPIPSRFRALINWPLSVRFTDHLGRSIGFHELPDMWDAVLHVVSHWDEEIAIALK
ncbi:hypothetical protein [Blastococcus sp. SYSU DS0539]